MRNHAIICSTELVGDLWNTTIEKAARLFPSVAITPPQTNGMVSLFIPPDGPKEGWLDSDEGDRRRDEFIAFLRTTYYADGSAPIAWVEVQFGDDERESRVLRSSDQDYASGQYSQEERYELTEIDFANGAARPTVRAGPLCPSCHWPVTFHCPNVNCESYGVCFSGKAPTDRVDSDHTVD